MADDKPQGISKWRSPFGLFMVAAGVIGAYYLMTEHLTHVTQAVPYLILLACPLMHLFHGGHGHGHGGHHRSDEEKSPQPT